VAMKLPAPNRASGLRGLGRLGQRALAVTALTSAAALALAACSSSSSSSSSSSTSSAAASSSGPSVMTTPASASQTISETGSSLMAPLFALWGPAYHTQFSQVTLSTASSSSGVGISSAAAGTVDIGASDAYLSPADMAKYTTLENIQLNGTVLAKIYSGKITKWNDPAITALNPGVTLPSASIVLVHRADSSGSTFLFTSYMDAQDSTDWSSSLIGTTVAWPKQPGEIGATGSGGVVSSVKSTTDSIGYVGVSYLSKVTAAGEGEAAVGNSSGSFLLPNASTIDAALAGFTTTPANEAISLINGAGAQAYPIINYEYAIVNTSQSSATLAQDIQAFLYWAVTSGTTQLASVNFQPLPASVVTLSEAQIAKITG
jgi:phosphate transport system substrate-binding protein